MIVAAKANPVSDNVSDKVRLQNKLYRLGAKIRLSDRGERVLCASETGGLLAALLREIDETILPRQLILTNDAGMNARLYVVSRRLLRVDLGGDEATGSDIANNPDEVALIFAGRLQGFLNGATELTVQTCRREIDSSPTDLGCSADRIAALTATDLDTPENECALEKFVGFIGGYSAAWLMTDAQGQPVKSRGPAARVRQLSDLCRDGLRELDDQVTQTAGNPELPGCILLGNGTDTGFRLFFARADQAYLLAVAPSQAVPMIMAKWRDRFI